ncbi:leucyl/phenylalanyl-tRNA--protein transferase [Polaribacter sp. BAL334]|uniref:leucyl/phenylalanyl-tRNA--protein transferase n=1 Tax=Polaribacter sp. BAL334 TaxID=1708178 RepID=UPI0018D246BD|nr:leucyl/phenylalanyl-tRNA--protein transferase [Polaribacter sp. BAL334]MBG7611661.1 leucyl/phenylalanyl-tRNA--protein transferase [Polaribacter sp. BAL334]
MMWLTEKIAFPPYENTSREGIIALGGDLSVERLIFAYKKGIFPWFSEGDPIVWYCPKKRMVLFPDELNISKSMKKVIQKNQFHITENRAFEEVIRQCKMIRRKDELGTWITDEMEQAYIHLHKIGVAKSIEVWLDNQLVGGLYGMEMNEIFCGESMFSCVSNASKAAFIHLVTSNKYALIDCQVYNKHLDSLGAREIDRKVFLELLEKYQ